MVMGSAGEHDEGEGCFGAMETSGAAEDEVRPHLNERQWRLALGAEAAALGRGGIALVAGLSGESRATVKAGVGEIRAGAESPERSFL
jgi:hypothetical protein